MIAVIMYLVYLQGCFSPHDLFCRIFFVGYCSQDLFCRILFLQDFISFADLSLRNFFTGFFFA